MLHKPTSSARRCCCVCTVSRSAGNQPTDRQRHMLCCALIGSSLSTSACVAVRPRIGVWSGRSCLQERVPSLDSRLASALAELQQAQQAAAAAHAAAQQSAAEAEARGRQLQEGRQQAAGLRQQLADAEARAAAAAAASSHAAAANPSGPSLQQLQLRLVRTWAGARALTHACAAHARTHALAPWPQMATDCRG